MNKEDLVKKIFKSLEYNATDDGEFIRVEYAKNMVQMAIEQEFDAYEKYLEALNKLVEKNNRSKYKEKANCPCGDGTCEMCLQEDEEPDYGSALTNEEAQMGIDQEDEEWQCYKCDDPVPDDVALCSECQEEQDKVKTWSKEELAELKPHVSTQPDHSADAGKEEYKLQCENKECGAVYAEYVNGCPKCATGEFGGSHSVRPVKEEPKVTNSRDSKDTNSPVCKHSEENVNKPVQWEYDYTTTGWRDDMEEFNELGKEGWELVCIDNDLVYFKRKVQGHE